MRIGIFGAGYVGLSTAVCLAQQYDVELVDIDLKKIESIKKGKSYIFEEDLERLLNTAINSNKLKAKLLTEQFSPFDFIFITVGTPSESDGYINLRYVDSISKTLKERRNEFLLENKQTLITLRSTVIPGTTNQILASFEKEELANIAFNPEFLSQGSAVKDTIFPRRVIIGANRSCSSRALEEFYLETLEKSDVPIYKMSIESAEFTKYVANAFLATKISFANEMADIVEGVENADIDAIMEGIGSDPRISPYFLNAGIGFGGSCFPKDINALVRFSENLSAETPSILSSVLKVNENRPFRLIKLLRQEIGRLNGKKVAILGITFKPGTNDSREAPSLRIIQALWRSGVKVNVHDPVLNRIDLSSYQMFNIEQFEDVVSCLQDVDACLILTEWPEYQKLDLETITKGMRNKIIIDGRRVFAQKHIPDSIRYLTIGSSKNRSPAIFNS